jgi:hypothetical protein
MSVKHWLQSWFERVLQRKRKLPPQKEPLKSDLFNEWYFPLDEGRAAARKKKLPP